MFSSPTAWNVGRQRAVVPLLGRWPWEQCSLGCSSWQQCVWHSPYWCSPRKRTKVTRDTHQEQEVRCLHTGSQTEDFNTSIFLSDVAPTPMPSQETEHSPYLIGVGRADCTGPPAEIPLVSFELGLRGLQARSENTGSTSQSVWSIGLWLV